MQKPTLPNKQLLSDIELLYNCLKAPLVSQDEFIHYVMNLLTETYQLSIHLEKKDIFKTTASKLEKSGTNVSPLILSYQKLSQSAKEREDEDLHWGYELAVSLLQLFQENQSKSLSALKLILGANLFLQNHDFFEAYIKYQQKYNPKIAKTVFKHHANIDLLIELYGLFEGYQISQQKLIKSTALKIFHYCLTVADCTMTEIATQIDYIFIRLEEDITLDPKRAVNVKKIGEYKNMILLDYGDNKKSILYDFGLSEIIEKSIQSMIKILKSQKQKDKIHQINTNVKLLETAFIGKLLS
ncbi:MAG: hypothetical protein PHN18_03000 [Sulfurospirillaceae bacterium]|nr:hypothetical protein [Sulfurospirillaceae bacterium]MDD2825625.1 hypothetical protein [Sulfurospirillaceae bacterium]